MNSGKFVLNFSRGHLALESNERLWCQAILVIENRSFELGAERMDYFIEHLLSPLEYPPDKRHWIFTLSERHCMAYATVTDSGGVSFHIIDGKAEFVADFAISCDEKIEWIQQIKSWS